MYTQALINYIELPSINLAVTKKFFTQVFKWEFHDYGSEYTSFTNSGINGGFYLSDRIVSTKNGSALVVLYSDYLEECLDKILENGGHLLQPIFSFPGGRRFHFSDPNGNEYAVWSAS